MIRQSVLTGLSTATSAVITAADTVLTALGKVQAQINAGVPVATLTAVGGVKGNVVLIQRTTTPISVNVASISALGATLLPSVSTTVTGVALGDFVQAAFAATPPTGLTISAVQVTAANTVLVTFVATQALTLAAGAQSLNFCWTR